jgi:zinc transport system substrate-binding protein
MQLTATMNVMVLRLLLVLAVLGVVPVTVAAPALTVGVSVLPEKYFVERIAGSYARVIVMVGPGQNPATYDPRPRQLSRLQDAKLYFLIGVPFEDRWQQTFASANPAMRLVSLIQDIKLIPLASGATFGEEVNTDNFQRHGIMDPHVWLSPRLVKIMAASIKKWLITVDGRHRDTYEANYQQFVADLDKLDQTIRTQLQNVQQHKFLVFHPSWGYYAREYGLQQVAIEHEGKQPSARSLSRIIEFAKNQDIKVVFVQQQFSQRDARTIAEQIGARVILVDPLAENYISNLYKVTQQFVEALQ